MLHDLKVQDPPVANNPFICRTATRTANALRRTFAQTSHVETDALIGSVEIYRTDVADDTQAAALVRLVESQYPGVRANVDLHDCDRVLRIAGPADTTDVERLVMNAGFFCRTIEG
jgi:hypothetical protein